MDLSEVMNLTEDQDRGQWLDILNPYDGSPVGLRLLIAGPDSRTQAKARLLMADELADVADSQGMTKAEQREVAFERFLARCVLQWEVQQDGQPVPFSFEAVLRLIKAGRWMKEQIDEFAGSRRAHAKGGR